MAPIPLPIRILRIDIPKRRKLNRFYFVTWPSLEFSCAIRLQCERRCWLLHFSRSGSPLDPRKRALSRTETETHNVHNSWIGLFRNYLWIYCYCKRSYKPILSNNVQIMYNLSRNGRIQMGSKLNENSMKQTTVYLSICWSSHCFLIFSRNISNHRILPFWADRANVDHNHVDLPLE